VNYVDWGPVEGILTCPPAALGCTTWWATGGGAIYERDIRLDDGYPLYVGTGAVPPGRYDFQSIATHEAGHGLGLEHASGSSYWLTMYYAIPAGTKHQRTLGWGDIIGLEYLYPP
jgi:hypothetical protein